MLRNTVLGVAIVSALALPGRVEAGSFALINIDGLYDDWAGVPVIDSDGGDNSDGPDIGDTQIANDNQNLYIRTTFPNNLTLNTFISIDVDQNAATGFDVLGLGVIGSEAAWQNDFAFSQATGMFNSGPMEGPFFNAGHGLLAPFGNFGAREIAISLDALNNGGLPTFPDDTIRLMIWTNIGNGADGLPPGALGDAGVNGDWTVIEYTLAAQPTAVPEPASLLLLTTGGLGLWFVRRKR